MKILLRLLAYLNRYKKQMLITYVCLFGIIGLNITKHLVIAYLCQIVGVDKRRGAPAPAPAPAPHSAPTPSLPVR